MKQVKSCTDNEVNIKPFAYAMSLIGGKWKMHNYFKYYNELFTDN